MNDDDDDEDEPPRKKQGNVFGASINNLIYQEKKVKNKEENF